MGKVDVLELKGDREKFYEGRSDGNNEGNVTNETFREDYNKEKQHFSLSNFDNVLSDFVLLIT